MAKQLSMGQVSSILMLHQSGHSNRQIAKLLGVHRETVAKYLAGRREPAKPDHRARSGPASACEPFREIIVAKLEEGLSGQRVYQDLCDEEDGFSASYSSLRRFVARLRRVRELPVRRIETPAGEEAQVDFGTGAWVAGTDGKRRRPWVFRIVLSHSRKAYSEAVWKQSTESFIACLENAFAHFGGVPRRLVIDNLKAAVARSDWYDPEIHPKLQSFARHYGTAFLPTKPYTPRHKDYASSCTSLVRSRAFPGNRRGSESLIPWCLIGRCWPGGSYRHSFLSL
jgi:transposase